MEERIFGEAGARVDIEKRLYGRELSFFCFTDGYSIVPMEAVQDYKRARDNDEGKNTGGMGAYSPHPWLDDALVQTIMTQVAEPLIHGVREKYGILYRGILYLGLMLTGGRKQRLFPMFWKSTSAWEIPKPRSSSRGLKPTWSISVRPILSRAIEGYPAFLGTALPALSHRGERAHKGQERLVQRLSGPLQDRRAHCGDRQIDADCLVFHSGTERDAAGSCSPPAGGCCAS